MKIFINPDPSSMDQCIAKTFHAIHIAMKFAKKIATLYNKNRQPATKTHKREAKVDLVKIGALRHVARQWD